MKTTSHATFFIMAALSHLFFIREADKLEPMFYGQQEGCFKGRER